MRKAWMRMPAPCRPTTHSGAPAPSVMSAARARCSCGIAASSSCNGCLDAAQCVCQQDGSNRDVGARWLVGAWSRAAEQQQRGTVGHSEALDSRGERRAQRGHHSAEHDTEHSAAAEEGAEFSDPALEKRSTMPHTHAHQQHDTAEWRRFNRQSQRGAVQAWSSVRKA